MINTEVIKRVIDEHYSSSREELESKILEAIKYEEIENYSTKTKSIWDLKTTNNEKYYQLSSMGDIVKRCFSDVFDVYVRGYGNAFLTIEEAEFMKERRNIEAIMRRYSRPFIPGSTNWSIIYSYQYDKLRTDICFITDCGGIYFESDKVAREVIDKIGEEKLKRYWFSVSSQNKDR